MKKLQFNLVRELKYLAIDGNGSISGYRKLPKWVDGCRFVPSELKEGINAWYLTEDITSSGKPGEIYHRKGEDWVLHSAFPFNHQPSTI
jgi:hypothetical protein